MTEEKYTAEQLEQMADQLLQEAAPAQDKPAKGGLDEKTIASLPAAALLNGNEKLRDLFTKGKKKGKLDAGELSDVLDELDLESEQMDSIYDSLEQLGIEVGSEDFLADLPDEDGEPAMDEIAEIEEEELVDPNTLVVSFNIDDPVRMYLKEIGQVKLLTQGGPGESANLIVYSIYRDAFFNYRFGSAAAQSVILFLIIMALTLVMFKVEKKGVKY